MLIDPRMYIGALAEAIAATSGPFRDNSPRGVAKPIPPKKVMRARRNDPCPCKSGKKYKRCCLPKQRTW